MWQGISGSPDGELNSEDCSNHGCGCCFGALTRSLCLFLCIFNIYIGMQSCYCIQEQRQSSRMFLWPLLKLLLDRRVTCLVTQGHLTSKYQEFFEDWECIGTGLYVRYCIFLVKNCISLTLFLSLEHLLNLNCIRYPAHSKVGQRYLRPQNTLGIRVRMSSPKSVMPGHVTESLFYQRKPCWSKYLASDEGDEL